MDVEEITARNQMLLADKDDLEAAGRHTKMICLAIIRSAIDSALYEDVAYCERSGNPKDEYIAKQFKPLIENLETGPVQMAYDGACNVFSNEPQRSRMDSIEEILKMVFMSVSEFSNTLETGKEFINEQEL